MKLTMSVGAAFGFAALAGCSQSGQDNSENMDANAAYSDETVLPVDESAPGTDTLGNQLDQLNGSDAVNSADTDEAAENASNSY